MWIDDWQMQCCGTPFAVNSRVSWSTIPVDDHSWYAQFLDPDVAAAITDREEHHSDASRLNQLARLVREIDAVFCRYQDDNSAALPVGGSGELEPRSTADGWEDDDALGIGRSFVGYLVTVDTAID